MGRRGGNGRDDADRVRVDSGARVSELAGKIFDAIKQDLERRDGLA